MVLADRNATLSGPMWDVRDFTDPDRNPPYARAKHILWRHGPAQHFGPHVADTRSLDFLCGYWIPGRRDSRKLWLARRPGYRAGGIGFYDVAELAGDYTPTQTASRNRTPRAIDGALLNESARDAYVPGSYRVYEPEDPKCPDSDHKRISLALNL